MNQQDTQDINRKVNEAAKKIIRLTLDKIIIQMRYMDMALSSLKPVPKNKMGYIATDGINLFYDPYYVVRRFHEDENNIVRVMLHVLFHCIFHHSFGYEKLDHELWDISCDIAIENIIMELDINHAKLKDDYQRAYFITNLKKNNTAINAEALYRYFRINPLAKVDMEKYSKLFKQDEHLYWSKSENFEISSEQWKRISERLKTDLGSFSKDKNKSESLNENLKEITKEKYNYENMLSRFMVMDEEITVNSDEYDYIYYTYGLTHYNNMPLIEPLEYRESNKIKDFAIVLDTSASCRGELIKSFLQKTYSILKSGENFFHHINVHIIQCDNEVEKDTVIRTPEDFDIFIKEGKLYGYGGTDFRPAFEYVERLINEREFTNLKGMIYFTDGYGIYPEHAPDFSTMFVFTKDDENAPELPWWAIKTIIEEEEV